MLGRLLSSFTRREYIPKRASGWERVVKDSLDPAGRQLRASEVPAPRRPGWRGEQELRGQEQGLRRAELLRVPSGASQSLRALVHMQTEIQGRVLRANCSSKPPKLTWLTTCNNQPVRFLFSITPDQSRIMNYWVKEQGTGEREIKKMLYIEFVSEI